MSTIKRPFKSLRSLAIVVLLSIPALLWGELYARMLAPQNLDAQMNIFASDPIIGLTYKPNSSTYEKGREYNALYRINSLGLRDEDYGLKQVSTFRILLLGDSFSVSHGMSIDDSLSKQLERSLQRTANIDGMAVNFEVINAAVGGYSPYNYWKALLKWAPIYKPDAVIVGISPDDYDSSNAGMKYIIEDGSILGITRDGEKQIRKRHMITRIRKWLSWNSHFYILLRNFFYYNEIVGRLSMRFGKNERQTPLQPFIIPQSEYISKSWKASFSYLDNLREAAFNLNIPLFMISIPLKEEIDRARFKYTLSASGLTVSQTDLDQPLNQLMQYCKNRNIPLFDPRQELKMRNIEVRCYFVYDGHWVAEGIRVASVSIAEQWKALNLAPWDKTLKERSRPRSQGVVCAASKKK